MTERPIALVGLRCSGKTRVGRELAARLGRPLVDLDDAVARAAGCESAGAVIGALGLERFRQLERVALARALGAREAGVLATGGGVVEDAENRARLAADTLGVWLRAAPTVLRARMQGDPTLRPALTTGDPLDEIEALEQRRRALYREVARLTLDTDALDVGGAAHEILKWLAERVDAGPGSG
jgi:shikimate kinase